MREQSVRGLAPQPRDLQLALTNATDYFRFVALGTSVQCDASDALCIRLTLSLRQASAPALSLTITSSKVETKH